MSPLMGTVRSGFKSRLHPTLLRPGGPPSLFVPPFPHLKRGIIIPVAIAPHPQPRAPHPQPRAPQDAPGSEAISGGWSLGHRNIYIVFSEVSPVTVL